ncbi:MAG: M24 family metallopeptidase, partial [Thermomicrobiales bacterium]
MSDNIVREKLAQAVEILNEDDVDLWMLVGRETDTLGDPSLPLVLGTSVTWESAFLVSRTGQHVAIVGTGDVENIKQTGAWENIVGYVEGVSGPLIEALERLDPNVVALNYSTDNNMADGITHGMYLLLEEHLKATPYWKRVRSAGEIPTKVRARKSPTELARIREAVRTTERIWEAVDGWLRPGLTEIEISTFMHDQLEERRIGSSWDWKYCPGVTAGPDSPRGHVGPTEIQTQAGHLITIDFGVNQNEYSSDMQRTFYFLKPGET